MTKGSDLNEPLELKQLWMRCLQALDSLTVKLAANAGVVIGDVDVKSAGITISQTPAVTAGAYSAGDAVGGLLTFANAARVSGDGGVVKSVTIIDDNGQGKIMELWLFDSAPTDVADNAAWSTLAEADMEKLVGIIPTLNGTWYAAGTAKACVIECAVRYDCVATSLYGKLVTRETPSFAAVDDVTVKIGLLQD
jgi:hypothetical protein